MREELIANTLIQYNIFLQSEKKDELAATEAERMLQDAGNQLGLPAGMNILDALDKGSFVTEFKFFSRTEYPELGKVYDNLFASLPFYFYTNKLEDVADRTVSALLHTMLTHDYEYEEGILTDIFKEILTGQPELDNLDAIEIDVWCEDYIMPVYKEMKVAYEEIKKNNGAFLETHYDHVAEEIGIMYLRKVS